MNIRFKPSLENVDPSWDGHPLDIREQSGSLPVEPVVASRKLKSSPEKNTATIKQLVSKLRRENAPDELIEDLIKNSNSALSTSGRRPL